MDRLTIKEVTIYLNDGGIKVYIVGNSIDKENWVIAKIQTESDDDFMMVEYYTSDGHAYVDLFNKTSIQYIHSEIVE